MDTKDPCNPKYQVFRVGVDGWFYQTDSEATARKQAERLVRRMGVMAYVVDTKSGAVIYRAECPLALRCSHGHPRSECEACSYEQAAEAGLAPRW